MKMIYSIILSILLIFNLNLPSYASDSTNTEKISLVNNTNIFLASDKPKDNIVTELFSPDDNNLDMTIGVILSLVPGFGAGHFWIGNKDDGWFFLKMDLLMLAVPLVLSMLSTIFYSLGIIKNASMQNSPPGSDVFSILGLVAWASALGIKIWETASVYRYVSDLKKNNSKINLKNGVIELKLASF